MFNDYSQWWLLLVIKTQFGATSIFPFFSHPNMHSDTLRCIWRAAWWGGSSGPPWAIPRESALRYGAKSKEMDSYVPFIPQIKYYQYQLQNTENGWKLSTLPISTGSTLSGSGFISIDRWLVRIATVRKAAKGRIAMYSRTVWIEDFPLAQCGGRVMWNANLCFEGWNLLVRAWCTRTWVEGE